MNSRMKRLAGWCAVIAVGLGSFLTVRLAASDSAAIAASTQIGDRYTGQEVRQMMEEDAKKPYFYGELNGITFKEKLGSGDIACVGPVTAADAEQAQGSWFGFVLSYLPADFELLQEGAGACDGQVVTVYRQYGGPGGEFEVLRVARTAEDWTAPADRIRTLPVRGKTAVVILHLPEPGVPRNAMLEANRSWRLYIKEGNGMTQITSSGLSLGEGLRVINGISGG